MQPMRTTTFAFGAVLARRDPVFTCFGEANPSFPSCWLHFGAKEHGQTGVFRWFRTGKHGIHGTFREAVGKRAGTRKICVFFRLREVKARILRDFARSWGASGGSWGPSGVLLGRSWRLLGPSWGSFWVSCRLLGLIFGLLEPPGAHFWPPGASWGSFLASWGLFRSILDPCLAHCSSFSGYIAQFSTKQSKTLFEITGQKIFRKQSKTLFETLVKRSFETTAGQRRRRPLLGGRFGARMRPLDPATEPLGSRGGRGAKRFLAARKHFAKAQCSEHLSVVTLRVTTP